MGKPARRQKGKVTSSYSEMDEDIKSSGSLSEKRLTNVQTSSASVSDTSGVVMMFVLKYVVASVSKTGFFIYLSILCGIAYTADLHPFPHTFFSNKKNFFNLYFVKLAWGWTFSLLGLFICLTSYAYYAGDRWWSVLRHLSRLVVGTVWWFVCTRLFDTLHDKFCQCHPLNSSSQQLEGVACEKAEQHWYFCHMSGHAFLLIYCLLVISEELRVYVNFEGAQPSAGKPRRSDRQNSRTSNKKLTFCIHFAVVALVALYFIWHVMLMATTVYFHHWHQKAIGGAFAIIGWLLTYRLWYVLPALQAWSPGPPGKGLKQIQ